MCINVEFNLRYLGRTPWTSNHKSNKIYIFDIWCNLETPYISQIEFKYYTMI